MSFFEELKRRNVVKVGVAYAIFAWLVLQIIDTVLPNFGAPQWVVSTLMFIILLGFPLALFIAWAFEITPEGIKPTHQVAVEESITPQTGQKLNTLIISILSLAVIFLVVDNYVFDDAQNLDEGAVTQLAADELPFQGEFVATPVAEKSIAVLPFANLSDDPSQEYFADGLSEELLNRLARIQDLLVAGRTSSFYFKGSNTSMREIGEELNVAHILEGSIRKSGNEIRVSAQLIQADNGFQLWSDTYDRSLEDIFAIQDEIAEAVITALSVTLSAGEFNRPGMTTNVQAYEAYLRADKSESGNIERNLETITHLENAVNIDPDFGLAWNDLYRAYEFATLALPPDQSAEYIPLAATALDQAGQLIPDTADFLVSSAVSQRRMGNWVDAENLFVRAIEEMGNSNALAGLNYGEMLWSVGRLKDAVLHLQRARRLDPKNVDIAVRLSVSLWADGQVNAADEEIARGFAINPDGFIGGARAYRDWSEGNFESIIFGTNNAPPDSPGAVINEAAKLLQEGDGQGAVEVIRAFWETQPLLSPVAATAIGPLAALGGDYELAVSFFAGNPNANANVNDVFGSLPIWQDFLSGMRQLDGFKTMAEEAGLVDYWRITGNWADKCQPLEGSDDFECI